MIGRVKTYLPEKGFGFVANEGGEWFFHKNQVINQVQRGDEVEFWLDDDPRGPGLIAVDVKRAVRS